MKILSAAALLAIPTLGCTLKVPGSDLNLTIQLPKSRESARVLADFSRPFRMFDGLIPPSIQQMDCFFLNVNGPGISEDGSASGQALSFLSLGISSTLADPTSGSVSMRVPSGLARTIQVLGIAGNPPLIGQCAGLTPADLLITKQPSLFEIGRATSSLFQDSTITIQSVYDPGSAYDLMSQYSGSLLLNQGYYGTNPLGGINTLMGGLPPTPTPGGGGNPDGTINDLSTATGALGTAFTALQDSANTHAGLVLATQPPVSGFAFARLDFAFALGSIDISQYSSFTVNGLVGGGVSDFVSGSCTAPSTNSGVYVAVYAPNDSPTWSTPSITMTTATSALTALTLPLTAEFMDSFNGERFIHVALLSTDGATAGFCSNLKVDQLTVTLNH